MNIEDLRNGSLDENVDGGSEYTNPNLLRNPPKKRETREIDPVKELGLKTQRELDQEDPEKRVYEDKIFDDIDKTIERKTKEFENFEELYEQSEGNVSYDDVVEMDGGFDPIAMLSDPPKPGHPKVSIEHKKNVLRSQGYSEEEINAILHINKPASKKDRVVPFIKEEPVYENEDINETEELEREILEGIPDESNIEVDTDYIAEIPADDNKNTFDRPEVISKDEYDSPVDNSTVLDDIPENQIIIEDRDEDKDLKDLDDDVVSDEDDITKKRLELLKQSVNSKIRPITSKFDISTFTFSKQPVNVNNVISKSVNNAKRGDWVLMGSERPITMRAFHGTELEVLISDRSSRNNVQLIREQYSMFYNHIEDPFKPSDLDSWAKCTAVTDIDNLYACAYRASFEGVNFLPFDCQNPKCNNSFVTDNIPFMDMVKFKNNKAKEKFNRIYNSTPNGESKKFKVEIVPISDTYAFGFKMPSIYDVVFVMSMLDDDFKEKYKDVIAISPYIDSMYYLDIENQNISPINVKVYRENIVKSTKAKIITLAKIVKELTSDQYNLIKIYTTKITDTDDEITFKMPAVTCEKCKSEIPEQEYSASQLLFLRHHLASLVNG